MISRRVARLIVEEPLAALTPAQRAEVANTLMVIAQEIGEKGEHGRASEIIIYLYDDAGPK